MKLVVTINLATRLGGAETALLTFLSRLDRDRIEPLVVFYRAGPFEREVAGLGVRTCALPDARIRQVHQSVSNLFRLRGILRQEQPDVVLNWLTGAQLHGAPAALLAGLGARNAWWQHDFPHGRDDRFAPILPGRHVAACSRAVADAQEQVWPHRRPRVIWPGIDRPAKLSSGEIADRRQRLSIPPRRPVVGIVGRLLPWKGQREFLIALSRLRAEGRDLHGLIVGGAPAESEAGYELGLVSLSRELALDGAVCFTGHRPDGHAYTQLMDVCVNASTREPFGIVLLEALASSVPAVAVDAGGPRDIVESERSGLLAPTNHPDDLARTIARVLDDRALSARLVSGGLDRYHAHFTADRMVADIQDWVADAAAAATAGGR